MFEGLHKRIEESIQVWTWRPKTCALISRFIREPHCEIHNRSCEHRLKSAIVYEERARTWRCLHMLCESEQKVASSLGDLSCPRVRWKYFGSREGQSRCANVVFASDTRCFLANRCDDEKSRVNYSHRNPLEATVCDVYVIDESLL